MRVQRDSLVPGDGWYLFHNNALEGPLACKNVLKTEPASKKKICFRWRGFARWYSLEDLIWVAFEDHPPIQVSHQLIHSKIATMVEQMQNLKTYVTGQRLYAPELMSGMSLEDCKTRLQDVEHRLLGKPFVVKTTESVVDKHLIKRGEWPLFSSNVQKKNRLGIHESTTIWIRLLIFTPLSFGLYSSFWIFKLPVLYPEIWGDLRIEKWERIAVCLPIFCFLPLWKFISRAEHHAHRKTLHLPGWFFVLLCLCPPLALFYLHLCAQDFSNLEGLCLASNGAQHC